jgi:hypothetical protein
VVKLNPVRYIVKIHVTKVHLFFLNIILTSWREWNITQEQKRIFHRKRSRIQVLDWSYEVFKVKFDEMKSVFNEGRARRTNLSNSVHLNEALEHETSISVLLLYPEVLRSWGHTLSGILPVLTQAWCWYVSVSRQWRIRTSKRVWVRDSLGVDCKVFCLSASSSV